MNTLRSSSTERFAYSVASLDDLETDAAALLGEAIGEEAISKIIVAPRQQCLDTRDGWRRWLVGLLPWRWTPTWVLVLTNRQLLVVTKVQPDANPTLHSILPCALLSVEVGVVLLKGWMTCVWAQHGRVEMLEVRFNTVSDEFFWEIQRWLCGAAALPAMPTTLDRQLNLLDSLPYRFKNLIPRRLLLPHEVVEAVIYQDAIWRRRLWLLKRRVAPSRVVLLTNVHILVASDEDAAAGGTSHGMIARYFPRRHVSAISVTPTDLGLTLAVSATHAAATTTYELLLERHLLAKSDDFLKV